MGDKQKSERDPIPDEFSSLEEAGEFWDTHSTVDYEDIFEPVEFEVDLPPRAGKRIRMAQALEKLAMANTLQSITNPVQWQREIREDHPRPFDNE